MFADAAYSSYFGKYISVNQIYQLGSLGQIAGDGNVLGASVSPLCLLTLVDYPFVIALYNARQREKKITLAQRKPADLLWYVGRYALLFTAAVGSWFYYSGNPDELRSVQKVNHIEFFTYHVNDLLVNVAGKMQKRGEAVSGNDHQNHKRNRAAGFRSKIQGDRQREKSAPNPRRNPSMTLCWAPNITDRN